jgi:general secretion pathway protein G
MKATLERLRQRRDERGEEGGFTLIELLIVVVILGILAAIVVFAVQNFTGTSAQSSCKTDYKSVETAAEAYKANTGAYPASVDLLVPTYLKDTPTNGTHYTITVDNTGAVSVNGTPGIAACSTVS